MSQPRIVLPITTIQPDFESILTDVKDGIVPEDTFWVSCYKTGEQSVHGKAHLTLNERDRDVREYAAACPSLGISHTRVAVPAKTYADPLPQVEKDTYRKISAFDIAPDGSQFAAGYDDGTVYMVSSASSSTPPIVARKCHLSSVTSVKYFPSSRVLLTAGADFALNILPADLPSASSPSKDPIRITPVRTLKAHTRTVTCTGIISRGRTVLSGSKDATLRLWDVSSGASIRTLASGGLKPVLALSLGGPSENAFVAPPDGDSPAVNVQLDPREVDTQDKVVFCALDSGAFQAFDLGTKASVFHSQGPTSAPLHAIAYAPAHHLVATGSGVGVVDVYDTRLLGTPLVSFGRNGASIEDLDFVSLSQSTGDAEVGLAIATEDGLPYVANVRPEGPSVRAELIVTDCEAVRSVCVGPGAGIVWTAGDDGVVRRYEGLSEEK
ncbi:hypothetical protein PHLGIDRAFT_496113 [Phlebiopsis gigantea 11061_1 CR5-6]|uniref:Uncharacterized protein n=1 Tax=Phlebiopsis gigantea (strain 11061_1 CR5-6) TaxID=745531 RepID=A0A0C3PSS3_PHLG1|nr:hypothetical protein PHLGIDRAFT_496113 [Phlebiopsis gigantea 11061_1 CR5-6]